MDDVNGPNLTDASREEGEDSVVEYLRVFMGVTRETRAMDRSIDMSKDH